MTRTVAAFLCLMLGVMRAVAEPFGIMTYNIHHGQGTDKVFDLGRIARIVNSANPCFAGLQEVDMGTARIGRTNTCEVLAEACGMESTFGKAMDFDGGGYGNALLSRETPLSEKRVALSSRTADSRTEPRALLLCEFDDCWVGTMHLEAFDEAARLAAVPIVEKTVKECAQETPGKPVFLTGDWNSKPSTQTLTELGKFLTVLSGPTSGTIDYIAVDTAHKSLVSVVKAEVLTGEDVEAASDHKPILVTVDMPPVVMTLAAGTVTAGRDFAEATVPVTATIVRNKSQSEQVSIRVTLTPVGGGNPLTQVLTVEGLGEHRLSPVITGLTPGLAYDVDVRAEAEGVGTVASVAGGSVEMQRRVRWIAESEADILHNDRWTDRGDLVTYTASNGVDCAEITTRFRGDVAQLDMDERKPGYAGLTIVASPEGEPVFAVLSATGWRLSDVVADNESGEFEAKFRVDRVRGMANYRVRLTEGGEWVDLGTFDIGAAEGQLRTVDFVSTVGDFTDCGLPVVALDGFRLDKNLVKDEAGGEYADFGAAKAAGATGVLSPLWLSTWSLGKGPGGFSVRDPDGLIAWADTPNVVRNENLGDGVTRKYYAEMSASEREAGAEKYLKSTVDLGLAKVITDNSVVKIGDFAVVQGSLAFKVTIDDVEVAKAEINDFVEVSDDLETWKNPKDAGATIDFDSATRVVTVTPPAGPRGFVRVKMAAEVEDNVGT